VLVPIYMGELAPPSMRGFFGTCTQTALVCGILAAALVAFPLGNAAGWRWMMAVTPVSCALQLLLAPFLHESPRWLLQRNPHSAQAALSLKQLYGLKTDQEVDLEISHILNASVKASSQPSLAPPVLAPAGPRPNPEAAQMRSAAQGVAAMAEGTMPLKGGVYSGVPGDAQAPQLGHTENSGESVRSARAFPS
jgi:MFS family permease